MELKYNFETNCFTAFDDNDELFSVEFMFPNEKDGQRFVFSQTPAYQIEEWHRIGIAENDSYSVYVKSIKEDENDYRIGWLIPFEALVSKEHDNASNKHFYEFAFNAYILLIQRPDIYKRLVDGESFTDIISTIYTDQNSVIMVVENSLLRQDLNINQLELSMYRNGYYKQLPFQNDLIKKPEAGQNETKLILHRSGVIFNKEKDKYLNPCIREFLLQHPTDSNPFIRFFYLYQLVEVMFDDFLIINLTNLINGINDGTSSVRQLNDELKNTTESERFKTIFSKSQLREADYEDLKTLCTSFLPNEIIKDKGIQEYVYQVRNRIIHRFRLVATDEVAINKINDHLFLFLMDLLINYKQ